MYIYMLQFLFFYQSYDKVQGTTCLKKTKSINFDQNAIWKVIPLYGSKFHVEFIFHNFNTTRCPCFSQIPLEFWVILTYLHSMNN